MNEEPTSCEVLSTMRSFDKPSGMADLLLSGHSLYIPVVSKQLASPTTTRLTLNSQDLLGSASKLSKLTSPLTLHSLLHSQRLTPGYSTSKLQDKLRSLELEINLTKEEVSESRDPWNEEPVEARFTEDTEDGDEYLNLPQLKWCAACQRETVAVAEHRPSAQTFWSSVAIFFLGGVLGCCMLPYLSNSCKAVTFHCGRCGHLLT